MKTLMLSLIAMVALATVGTVRVAKSFLAVAPAATVLVAQDDVNEPDGENNDVDDGQVDDGEF